MNSAAGVLRPRVRRMHMHTREVLLPRRLMNMGHEADALAFDDIVGWSRKDHRLEPRDVDLRPVTVEEQIDLLFHAFPMKLRIAAGPTNFGISLWSLPMTLSIRGRPRIPKWAGRQGSLHA